MTGDRLMWSVWWGQRRRLALGMSAGITWMVSQALVPLALGMLIDRGIRRSSLPAFVGWTCVVAALFLIQAGLWIVRHHIAVGIFNRSLGWVNGLLGERTLEPQGGIDGRILPGELVSMSAGDNRQIASAMDISCRGSGAIVVFIAILVAMFVSSWRLALVVICAITPLLVLLLIFLHKLERAAHRQQRTLARASAHAADYIGALRVLKGVGAERIANEHYADFADEIRSDSLRAARVRAQTMAIDLAMSGAIVGIIAWYGGKLAARGDLSVGQLVTFAGWSVFLVIPLLTFNEMGRKVAMGRAAANRIAAVLATPYTYSEPASHPVILAEPKGAIRFANVTAGKALQHFDLDIAAGSFTCIVGDSRAHSMIAALLDRSITEYGGAVTVDGIEMRQLSLASLRRTVLIAEHDAVLFRGSLRDNLLVGQSDATDAELLRALDASAGGDIVDMLREGLDGLVSERGRSLSGGQRQRVGLARALVAAPPVLVLVDPTSAVDSFTEAEMVERFPKLRAGKTTIVLTSSPVLLEAAGEVVVIHDGAVAARGPHQQLLDVPSYSAQFSWVDTAGADK